MRINNNMWIVKFFFLTIPELWEVFIQFFLKKLINMVKICGLYQRFDKFR